MHLENDNFLYKIKFPFIFFVGKIWCGHVVMGLTHRQMNSYAMHLFLCWLLIATEHIFFEGNQSEDAVGARHT